MVKEKTTKKAKQAITKDMNFAEVIKKYPQTVEVFFEAGMGCAMCHMAEHETIEQGCQVHGIDADKFVEILNKKAKKK